MNNGGAWDVIAAECADAIEAEHARAAWKSWRERRAQLDEATACNREGAPLRMRPVEQTPVSVPRDTGQTAGLRASRTPTHP